MSDERKSPVDKVLDLFVYAPLGLLMNLDEVVPELVQKGRQQIPMARMFGQFAVQAGQAEATKRMAKVQEQVEEVAQRLGGRTSTNGSTSGANGEASSPPQRATVYEQPAARATPPAPAAPAPELAIPDYDSLAASQVVPRLEGLSDAELEAVREYEAGHRGRKTILNRIAQLQS